MLNGIGFSWVAMMVAVFSGLVAWLSTGNWIATVVAGIAGFFLGLWYMFKEFGSKEPKDTQ